MAERKYDLALVETIKNKPVKYQEWYKERLRTKYIKKLKSGEIITNNDTKNWMFLKAGVDDFRDGLPPVVGNVFLKSRQDNGLDFSNDFVTIKDVKPAMKKHFSRYQTYLSRSTPQQQQRRNFVTAVEHGLLQYPMALYPHLEESVAPEVFEDLVDILDPQLNIQDMYDMESLARMNDHPDIGNNPSTDSLFAVAKTNVDDKSLLPENLHPRNLYTWLPRKDNKKDGKKSKEKDGRPWPGSPSEEEHIKKVTQEFCDWVADLGGESNNIEESTITSLFASGYETKPALSVPIHVVDLANVPPELRISAVVPPPPIQDKRSVGEKSRRKSAKDSEPSWFKFRYGAWYLKPTIWKKIGFQEPLEDPKQVKENEMSEARNKCETLNQELANIHATKAFSDFISKKNTRKPEFLLRVAEIQRKAAEEEQKKQEVELQAKQKRANQLYQKHEQQTHQQDHSAKA